MSRQLSRIRSIISEIEEIQKQGQSEGKAQMQQYVPMSAPAAKTYEPPVASAPEEIEEQVEQPVVQAQAQVIELKSPVKEDAQAGKIAISLTGNVVVALQVENTNEIVEIRQVQNSIEIRFTDGKAVHLPLKNVA